jgi:hypothetical protein
MFIPDTNGPLVVKSQIFKLGEAHKNTTSIILLQFKYRLSQNKCRPNSDIN